MGDATRTFRLLGYGGLVPFVVPAILIVAGTGPLPILLWIVNAYAFGIVCFLTGSWWGMALAPGRPRALMLSNLYFLAATAVFVFAPAWWPLIAAVLLAAIYLAEQHTRLFPPTSAAYRSMRVQLTLVASLSMLTVHYAAR